MNRKEFLKTGMLAAAAMVVALALMSWIPNLSDQTKFTLDTQGGPHYSRAKCDS